MIFTIISIVLVISFLVFAHELGHYLGARAVGVKVLEFSIGFPPKIFSKKVGETEYMISLIPIGGFVRLLGQNIDDEDPDQPGNYASKSIFRRFIIMVSGPLANLIVAFLIMPLIFWSGYEVPAYMLKPPVVENILPDSGAAKLGIEQNDRFVQINGIPVSTWREVSAEIQSSQDLIIELKIQRDLITYTRSVSPSLLRDFKAFGIDITVDPVIGTIARRSAAEKAGLKKGDRVIAINGETISAWSQISPALQKSGDSTIEISILRNGQPKVIAITPEWNDANQYWVIGVTSQTEIISEPFLSSILLGAKRVIALTRGTYEFLARLVTGKEKSDAIGGPIMIAQMVGQAAHTNLSSLLALVAFISLQFCIFNLLPIPALDGGHILFLIFEKIKGSALSAKFRLTVQKIGFSLLMTLILLISIQDTIRVFFK